MRFADTSPGACGGPTTTACAPSDWARTAAIIGGVGDWANADVSPFVKEFAGHPQDLRQRLIGESFDSFVARKDVDIVFSEIAPFVGNGRDLDRADSDEVDDFDDFNVSEEEADAELSDEQFEQLQEMSELLDAKTLKLAAKTRSWVESRGETPSLKIQQAWKGLITSRMMADQSSAKPAELGKRTIELMHLQTRLMPEETRPSYEEGVDQVCSYIQANPDVVREVS